MDEGAGCIGAIVAVIVVVALVLWVLAWIFLGMSQVFGHPLVVVVMLAAAGGAIATLRHDGRTPQEEGVSEAEFAEFGGLRMRAAQWAVAVMVGVVAATGLFGLVVM
jgi:hypothetical protein